VVILTRAMESLESISLAEGAAVRKSSGYIWARRYIGAFFIYIIYSIMLWGAFKKVVGASLSPQRAEELVEEGIISSVWEYGWGEHYIWFSILLCLATYCSAIVAGAAAKKRGAVIAAVANSPGVLLLSFFCLCLYASEIKIENSMGWKIVLPISILGSIFLSIVGGSTGEKWQNKTFASDTILGMRPIHWWWLIFPLYLAIIELVPKMMATLRFLVGSTTAKETKYGVLLFLISVVFATFIYFLIWGWFKALRLLTRQNKADLSKLRIVLSVLFYLLGIPLLFDLFCALVLVLFT